ncbi:hypothetical protein MKX01_009564 [Papaver californicum]|nr:hypothetical protein MKX01_009564 [Papaver californicum]
MESGRLPKKGPKARNLSKMEKLHDSERNALYFEAPSAVVEDSSYVYPLNYWGRSCTLSNYSSLPTLVDLWSVLSKEEIALFKKTALVHLTDILREQSYSSVIFCFLMSRQIKVDPGRCFDDEIFFRVSNK